MPFPPSSTTRGRGVVLSIAVAGTFLLSACSAKPIHPEAVMVEKANKVEWQVHRHSVQFGVGTAEPGRGELERLAEFLAPYDEATGAYVFIDAGAELTGEELSRRRVERLRSVVAARGFTLRGLPSDPAGRPPMAADPRAVTVLVGEYQVTPPACPDTRKQTSADFTNTATSNFGCSTVTILGQMVANPTDLVFGRDPGPADAERAVLGVQRYRQPPRRRDGSAAIDTVATTGGTQ